MKKYKLQQQMPEFEEYSDGATIDNIDNMLYQIETSIGKIKTSLNLNTIGTLAFSLSGSYMISEALNSVQNNNTSYLISIGAIGLGFAFLETIQLKKKINSITELSEARGKILQLKNFAESYICGYNYEWYDYDDEISRIKKREEKYLPKKTKTRKKK